MTTPSHEHPTTSPTDADLIADAREHARILRRADCNPQAALLDRLADAVERATGERDAMVARWPDDRNGAGPVLYQHSDGRWFLETIKGDLWPGGNSGPFPAREAAVRAAAGLDQPDGEGGVA